MKHLLRSWDRGPARLHCGSRRLASTSGDPGRVAAPLAASPPSASSCHPLETQLAGGGGGVVVEASPGYLTALDLIDRGHRDLHSSATRRLADQGSDVTASGAPLAELTGALTAEPEEASTGRAQAAQAFAVRPMAMLATRANGAVRLQEARQLETQAPAGTAPAVSERFSRLGAGWHWCPYRRDSRWRRAL